MQYRGRHLPPPKKSKKQQILDAILLFLGADFVWEKVGQVALYDIITKDPESLIRDVVTRLLADSNLYAEKDWYAEPDACAECSDMADQSPYPIDYEMDTHPNCRCSWIPRGE